MQRLFRKGKIVYYPILPDIGEPGAERSDDVRVWLERSLISEGQASYNEKICNAYLVASGDGGLMTTARDLCRSRKVIVGAHRGTRGFLLNRIDTIDELPRNFSELQLVTVKLIRGIFFRKNGEIKRFLAFNDIYCGVEVSDFAGFTIKGTLNGFPERTVHGNGVVVSTPQGTTAYALNNRGSSAVLPLDSRTWFISGMSTGIYPCDVVSPQRIEITITSRVPVNGYADSKSQKAEDVSKIIIEPTKFKVSLGFLKGYDFEAKRRLLAQKTERGEI